MAKRRTLDEGDEPARRKLEVRIREWLRESGNYVGSQQIPGMEFAFQARYPKNPQAGTALNLIILKPKDDGWVGVLSNISLSDQHRQLLGIREPRDRQKFFADLGREMLFQVGYSVQVDPTTKEVGQIQLLEEIYFDDDLRRKELYDAMKAVYRGFILISTRLSELGPSPILGT